MPASPWWTGKIGDRTGVFPSNYVEVFFDPKEEEEEEEIGEEEKEEEKEEEEKSYFSSSFAED